MEVTLIAAMDEDRGIGLDNRIPWKNAEDMRRFRRATMCHPIIMGRKTFESLGGPLVGRLNIVVTSKPDMGAGVLTASSVESALASLRMAGSMFEEVYIIGGGKVYEEVLAKQLVDRIDLSIIPGSYGCDTFFPQIPPAYTQAYECATQDLTLCVWELVS